MKVRMCPLCDSEMKKAHYCDTCHSFIWHPDIVDIHYHAQQRGLGEEDCAYGSVHDQEDHKVQEDHKEVFETKTHTQEDNKRRAGGCLAKIILVIAVLNALMGSVGTRLIQYFQENRLDIQAENVLDKLGLDDVQSALYDLYEDDDNEDDGAVPAETESEWLSTSDSAAFDLTEEEFEQLLSTWVDTEYGSSLRKTGDPVWQEVIYTDEDGNEYSAEKILSQYGMGKDGEFLMVYSDPATGNICAVDASMRDRGRAADFFAAMAQILDSDNDYETSDWNEVLDEMMEQSGDDYDEQQGSGSGKVAVDQMILGVSVYGDGEIWLTFDAADSQ